MSGDACCDLVRLLPGLPASAQNVIINTNSRCYSPDMQDIQRKLNCHFRVASQCNGGMPAVGLPGTSADCRPGGIGQLLVDACLA